MQGVTGSSPVVSTKQKEVDHTVDLFLFDGAAERPARSEWNESGSHSKRSRRRACSPAASAGILPLGQNPVVSIKKERNNLFRSFLLLPKAKSIDKIAISCYHFTIKKLQ